MHAHWIHTNTQTEASLLLLCSVGLLIIHRMCLVRLSPHINNNLINNKVINYGSIVSTICVLYLRLIDVFYAWDAHTKRLHYNVWNIPCMDRSYFSFLIFPRISFGTPSHINNKYDASRMDAMCSNGGMYWGAIYLCIYGYRKHCMYC